MRADSRMPRAPRQMGGMRSMAVALTLATGVVVVSTEALGEVAIHLDNEQDRAIRFRGVGGVEMQQLRAAEENGRGGDRPSKASSDDDLGREVVMRKRALVIVVVIGPKGA